MEIFLLVVVIVICSVILNKVDWVKFTIDRSIERKILISSYKIALHKISEYANDENVTHEELIANINSIVNECK